MSRETPEAVQKAVRAFDPNAEVRHDGKNWNLHYRGERLFALRHNDGTPLRNADGHADEIVNIMRQCDNSVNGEARRRGLYAEMQKAKQRRIEAEEKLLEEGRRESEKVTRCVVNGPKGFVGPRGT